MKQPEFGKDEKKEFELKGKSYPFKMNIDGNFMSEIVYILIIKESDVPEKGVYVSYDDFKYGKINLDGHLSCINIEDVRANLEKKLPDYEVSIMMDIFPRGTYRGSQILSEILFERWQKGQPFERGDPELRGIVGPKLTRIFKKPLKNCLDYLIEEGSKLVKEKRK